MDKSLKLFGLVAALMLLGTACHKSSGSSATSEVKGTININGETANNTGTKTVTGGAFTLELDNDGAKFYFNPTVLKGSAGQTVTLTLKNAGSVHHNFTLEDQQINQDLEKPGDTATVTVTMPQSGVIEFHCEYHQGLGMVGELQSSA